MSQQISTDKKYSDKAVIVLAQLKDESCNLSLLDELEELVNNCDIEVVEKFFVKIFEPNAKFLIGSGKAAEIALRAKTLGASMIVFDNELSPSQQRNLEREFDICVIDRHEVILDIFSSRAQTKEACLQVELARLEYSLPRLRRAWTHLNRQRGGGVTQRGEGESQLELDQRQIREKIAKLKRELAVVRKNRETQRKKRLRVPFPTAAVVGYTNAGKSTLLNKLSNANVLAQDLLFATLDPTTRMVKLPLGQSVLLTDTVGFVRNLPHQFVEAFKSTLEETLTSDFLIHIVDSSSEDVFEHIATTHNVLKELGVSDKKTILVFNKDDLANDDVLRHQLHRTYPYAITMSLKKGEGIDELLSAIEAMLESTYKVVELLIPHSQYKFATSLHEIGAVRQSKHTDAGIEITAKIPTQLFEKYETFTLSKI